MISVIIATYNRATLLPRALASLARQTCPDWEAVIIDDGSTDNTAEVVGQWAARDPRLRYFAQANGGLTAARNAGLARAQGTYFTFLDSDDEYTPDHLATRLELIQSDPAIDLLHGGIEIVGGPDEVPDLHDPTHLIRLQDCFIGGTFFMHRSVYEMLGGFRLPDYGNDYEFMLRAAQKCRVVKVEAPTYVYHRETPDSMCNLMESSAVVPLNVTSSRNVAT